MRYWKKERHQRELPFDPQQSPISLPKSVEREAIGAVAALIAWVMQEPVEEPHTGGEDD